MGLINSIFGSKEKTKDELTTQQQTTQQLSGVLKLFPEYDFKKAPQDDERFVVTDPIENGVRLCPQREIKKPIHGIFTDCIIRWFPTGEKNIHFTNDNPSSVSEADVKAFVNKLYSIKGDDDQKSGSFTDSDRRGLQSGFWLGRNYNSHRPSFNVCMHGDEFNMTISLGKEEAGAV